MQKENVANLWVRRFRLELGRGNGSVNPLAW